MTDDEGWEARMAVRARARREARGEPSPWPAWADPHAEATATPEEVLAAAGHGESVAWYRYTEALIGEQRAAHPEWFNPEPPDDGHCLGCSTWKIENERMGRYAWWATCPHLPGPYGDGQPCPCCHCDEAVLIG